MKTNKKELSSAQQQELLKILKARFEKNVLFFIKKANL